MLSGLTYGMATYMPMVTKYLGIYLALGIPGLWLSIRYSTELVDTTNPRLVEKAYMAWPVYLLGVCKDHAKLAFDKLVKIAEGTLCLIAGSAEKIKRKKLATSKPTTLQLMAEYDRRAKQIEEQMDSLMLPE